MTNNALLTASICCLLSIGVLAVSAMLGLLLPALYVYVASTAVILVLAIQEIDQ